MSGELIDAAAIIDAEAALKAVQSLKCIRGEHAAGDRGSLWLVKPDSRGVPLAVSICKNCKCLYVEEV